MLKTRNVSKIYIQNFQNQHRSNARKRYALGDRKHYTNNKRTSKVWSELAINRWVVICRLGIPTPGWSIEGKETTTAGR